MTSFSRRRILGRQVIKAVSVVVCFLAGQGCGQVFVDGIDAGAPTDVGPAATDAGADTDATDAATDAGADATDAGIDAMDASDTGPDAFDVTTRALAVYFLDDAESGQGPLMLADGAAEPLNLELQYNGATPVFGRGATGHLLSFAGSAGEFTGGGLARIAGTKLEALDGARTATLEAVFRFDTCQGIAHQRAIGLGSGNDVSEGWLAIRTYLDSLAAVVSFEGQTLWTAVLVDAAGDRCPVSTRSVVHFVVDTRELDEADRLRVYINGARVGVELPASHEYPPLNGTIDFREGPATVYLGRAHSLTPVPAAVDVRTANSDIYFAAIYDAPLTTAEIRGRAAHLVANDDR